MLSKCYTASKQPVLAKYAVEIFIQKNKSC